MIKRWLCLLLLVPASLLWAAPNPEWTTPLAPFRIADNLYYVGSKDLASYLVVTAKGDILVNSSLESSPALIKKSVEQLGFHFSDIKILLISHSHADHDAGSAEVKRLTGAKYMVMDGDVPVVESGGAKDFAYPTDLYPAVKVDRVLHDGDEVRLGDAVIVGSWNVNPGYRLVDKPGKPASYPGIAADYEHSFVVWKSLPCDVFLGAHGEYFDMLGKLARAKAGAGESVWIDPEGYKAAVAEREQAFAAE